MQRLFELSSSYRSFFQLPRFSKKKPIIGIVARDVKARSKPMRDILNRIIETGYYEIKIFGDKVILDEPIENWPICDFMISFFSNGFPLDKAIRYVELRKPFCVNDLPLQKVLWDRRLVMGILEAIDVPAPDRLIVSRDGGPVLDKEISDKLPGYVVDYLNSLKRNNELIIIDQDTIQVDGKRLTKPFVEKPVDGENHNINIYYHSSQGGGTRKLFRKVANKSSEFFPEENELRMEGSFIYEKFVDVDNAEDIKVYTVGPHYAHAETRKSPVVDGLVRRNVDGKEMRFITELSSCEIEMATKICMIFGQNVCGLDLLRENKKSYVIDVNGWSFVKGNQDYYAKAAEILLDMFKTAEQRRYISHVTDKEPTFENVWTLKGFVSVFRHADRTPKQKAKFKMSCTAIEKWLDNNNEEVILRKPQKVKEFKGSIETAITDEKDEEEKIKLTQINMILKKKGDLPGTKIQIKPSLNKVSGELESMQVIIKWGGEFTHAATHHSSDLGLNMRKDLTIINKRLLDDVTVYSSSEKRVVATAEAFIIPFLNMKQVPSNFIKVEKEMLDDSNDAKEQTDLVKAELKQCMKESDSPLLKYFETCNGQTPRELAQSIKTSLLELRDIMRNNLSKMNLNLLKEEQWCCNDNPQLFKERWEKLIKEYCDVDQIHFDPGKVCELYDSLKYDALHNRDFLEAVFTSEEDNFSLEPLKQLYKSAKMFFDLIAPREYGITKEEKISIGVLTSRNLLTNIVKDLLRIKDSDTPASILYFTKESHVHTLLNIVLNSGLPVNLKPNEIGELDYLTQITFELYECQRPDDIENLFSLRLGFSAGAHHSFIMDLQMDEHHALSVASRRDLTDHMDLDLAIDTFNELLSKDYKLSNGLENWESPIQSPSNISPILSPSDLSLNSKTSTPSIIKE